MLIVSRSPESRSVSKCHSYLSYQLGQSLQHICVFLQTRTSFNIPNLATSWNLSRQQISWKQTQHLWKISSMLQAILMNVGLDCILSFHHHRSRIVKCIIKLKNVYASLFMKAIKQSILNCPENTISHRFWFLISKETWIVSSCSIELVSCCYSYHGSHSTFNFGNPQNRFHHISRKKSQIDIRQLSIFHINIHNVQSMAAVFINSHPVNSEVMELTLWIHDNYNFLIVQQTTCVHDDGHCNPDICWWTLDTK